MQPSWKTEVQVQWETVSKTKGGQLVRKTLDVDLLFLHIHMHPYTCNHTYVYTYTCMHTHTHMYNHIYIHIHVVTHMYSHMPVCMCMPHINSATFKYSPDYWSHDLLKTVTWSLGESSCLFFWVPKLTSFCSLTCFILKTLNHLSSPHPSCLAANICLFFFFFLHIFSQRTSAPIPHPTP